MKEKQVISETTNHGEFLFWCSGCGEVHPIQTMKPRQYANHLFNNNLFKPTFKLESGQPFTCSDNDNKRRCHFTITDGVISYNRECTHHLAGFQVEMREYQEWETTKIEFDAIIGEFKATHKY